MTTREHLGVLIRELRAEKRMSQEAIAGRAAIHRNKMMRLEAGTSMFTLGDLELIGEALGVAGYELWRMAHERAVKERSL